GGGVVGRGRLPAGGAPLVDAVHRTVPAGHRRAAGPALDPVVGGGLVAAGRAGRWPPARRRGAGAAGRLGGDRGGPVLVVAGRAVGAARGQAVAGGGGAGARPP